MIIYEVEDGYAPNNKRFANLNNVDAYMLQRGYKKICDPNPENNSKGYWERQNNQDFANMFKFDTIETVYVSYFVVEDL